VANEFPTYNSNYIENRTALGFDKTTHPPSGFQLQSKTLPSFEKCIN
jgi:hypothetical protein